MASTSLARATQTSTITNDIRESQGKRKLMYKLLCYNILAGIFTHLV